MADTPNQRQDERLPLELVATLHWNRQAMRLLSSDVSCRGLFLRTDTPPTLRQLVRIEVEIGPGEVLSMHGMAVHVVQPGDPNHEAGVGVQFYAVERDVGLSWRRFVDQVQRARRVEPLPTVVPPPPPPAAASAGLKPAPRSASVPRPRMPPPQEGSPPPLPARRAYPRYDAELELDLRSVNELRHLFTRDVSRGGMFIVTDAPLDPGASLLLQVLHPSRQESFELAAVVRRRDLSPAGIGVEFTDLTPERREAFMAFIQEKLPMEDVLFIQENDPDLA